MRRNAKANLDTSNVEVEWLGLPSELTLLEDESADTVVLTYTLCTIDDPMRALAASTKTSRSILSITSLPASLVTAYRLPLTAIASYVKRRWLFRWL